VPAILGEAALLRLRRALEVGEAMAPPAIARS
jgi:hypothetical protein